MSETMLRMPWLADGLRLLIGAIWLVAGLGKLRNRDSVRATLQKLTRLPPSIAMTLAGALPPVEISFGLLLISGWQSRYMAILSAAMFVLFAVLIGRRAIRDALKDGGCGCFGKYSRAEGLIDVTAPMAFARNLVFAALAVAAAAG